VNEAALLAARRNKRLVTMSEFEEAKDKVLMGSERRSMVMTEEERTLTAYHEAGHAIVGRHVPKHDPLHKVTIIPRGRALGLTMSLPEKDRLGFARIELESRIAMIFGGRVAEEMIFGSENVTTGAGNDIIQATNLARRMVTEFGFSEKLGPLHYEGNEEEVFLGHSVTQRKNLSEATAALIDEEVRRIVEQGEQTARDILEKHRDELEIVAKALLEYETLSGEEVNALLRGETIVRPAADEPPPERKGRSSVPTTGGKSKDAEGGGPSLEPEPQPGT
jgi:cell division protease FtsH